MKTFSYILQSHLHNAAGSSVLTVQQYQLAILKHHKTVISPFPGIYVTELSHAKDSNTANGSYEFSCGSFPLPIRFFRAAAPSSAWHFWRAHIWNLAASSQASTFSTSFGQVKTPAVTIHAQLRQWAFYFSMVSYCTGREPARSFLCSSLASHPPC